MLGAKPKGSKGTVDSGFNFDAHLNDGDPGPHPCLFKYVRVDAS